MDLNTLVELKSEAGFVYRRGALEVIPNLLERRKYPQKLATLVMFVLQHLQTTNLRLSARFNTKVTEMMSDGIHYGLFVLNNATGLLASARKMDEDLRMQEYIEQSLRSNDRQLNVYSQEQKDGFAKAQFREIIRRQNAFFTLILDGQGEEEICLNVLSKDLGCMMTMETYIQTTCVQRHTTD